ncbi:alpha/beta hydrolase [Sphingomonas sp. AP4-R1]|uniref:alpha/beta hydrolase n=1 Tax=Sphingomonas sp. AP4-R1 TaxID=2735134 RepID=UPI001493A228|nr:alpha/beta hydrolase [Sphingomonas sp. AP4-R1]QJU60034.1 alpha/beta hydrolase [Sphingomonas sp. AP4-R1]
MRARRSSPTLAPRLAGACLAGLLAGAAGAQAPAPAVSDHPVVEDHYPARQVMFAGGVTGLPDLVYAQPAGFRPLTLDVYLPPRSLKPPRGGFPLILHIHGGGWSAGHSRHSGALSDFPAVLASLAAKGYVVASLNYRLSGEAPFPAAEKDVKIALRWLRARAADYRMDPDRAGVWGGSAGGHLAALAAVTCKDPTLDPVGPVRPGAIDGEGRPLPANPLAPLAGVSDCVQAAVTWYGVFDFATIDAQAKRPVAGPGGNPQTAFLGCTGGDCTAAIKAASPVSYVDPSDPPMLLIAGMADRTVPYQQTVEFEAALKAARVPVRTILIPDVDHSFIGKTPDATRDATLKALSATFAFFDQTLRDQNH